MQIVPHIYQKLAIPKAVEGLQKFQRALIIMATGLGKTITVALVAKELRPKKILFLVHSNNIINHAMVDFRLVLGKNFKMATYNGLSKDGAAGADMVFATWQTMRKNLMKWPANYFNLIIVDEAHHSEAATYAPVVDYFTGPRIGMTATPERSDNADIQRIFGPPVVTISIEEAIARGWLPRIEYHIITDESLDEKALQKVMGEIRAGKKRFTMAEVNRRLFIKKRDDEIAKIINSYDQKAAVFCRSIAHAENMSKALDSAKAFHSDTGNNSKDTWNKNQVSLESLRSGEVRRITVVDAFNEGIHIPSIGLVAFLRSIESLRVFLQQLGRGLDASKDVLIALDFVGNLERIQVLREMMNKISDLHEQYTPREEMKREGYKREKLEVSGKGFEFTFSDQVVNLMNILKHCEQDHYPTWQEASKAAQALGIKSSTDHIIMYRKDPRLPSWPNRYYKDFPGFDIFYGRQDVEKYPTWQQASKAVLVLGGIKNRRMYAKVCHKDPLLPKTPNHFYEDFPGWVDFLSKESKYATWQQAAIAVRKMKVNDYIGYLKACEKDLRLPKSLANYYRDYPGWTVFLGGISKYKTWQEASRAIKKLAITSGPEYRKRYAEDACLYTYPERSYPDFPGWTMFCTGKAPVEFYSTWQKASKAAQQLGLTTQSLYKGGYHRDRRLPSSPNITYKNDWPGFTKFFGVTKRYSRQYTTCAQAMKATKRFRFTSRKDYESRCQSCDPRLPICPGEKYSDFPGWPQFLGKK